MFYVYFACAEDYGDEAFSEVGGEQTGGLFLEPPAHYLLRKSTLSLSYLVVP